MGPNALEAGVLRQAPRTLIWPLVGCAVGALAVYWYGPMLIVFGMFVSGTCGVVLRELVLGGGEDAQ